MVDEEARVIRSEDGPVGAILNPDGSAPVCLVCEHAGSAIPAALGDLGLKREDRFRHAVWDIGAGALAARMSERLDAQLVIARFSRLVYDLNRAPDAPDALSDRTEVIDVPGNRNLAQPDRAARVRDLYDPFHGLVASALDGFRNPPALVTVHSFTPNWHGTERETEIGLLHDDDPTLARAMLEIADQTWRTELNQPYSAKDGVTHTLARHGTARGLQNVMIEVRNDLLAEEAGIDRIAEALCDMLRPALSDRLP